MHIIGGNFGFGGYAGLVHIDLATKGMAEQIEHSFAYAECRNANKVQENPCCDCKESGVSTTCQCEDRIRYEAKTK